MSSRERALNALQAVFVADAALMPSHWIYAPDKLKEVLGTNWDTPEFHDPPSCPFYSSKEFPGHYELGDSSPYAEEGLAVLDYVEKEGGDFVSGEAFASSLQSWAATYDGRKNHATKLFEENVAKLEKEGAKKLYPDCGADDSQANCFWKVVSVAPRYAGTSSLADKCTQAIRTHQNTDLSEECGLAFARMLDAAASGSSMEDAIEAGGKGASALIQGAVKKAKGGVIKSAENDTQEELEAWLAEYCDELFEEGMNEMYKSVISRTCGLPQSLVVGVKVVLDALKVAESKDVDVFKYAVRRNIHAGGDTCGRIPVVAGLLGASGFDVPAEWCDRAKVFGRVTQVGNMMAEK